MINLQREPEPDTGCRDHGILHCDMCQSEPVPPPDRLIKDHTGTILGIVIVVIFTILIGTFIYAHYYGVDARPEWRR